MCHGTWTLTIIKSLLCMTAINTLRPKQNGHHFADDTFKRIFLNENVRISIKISLKFVPKGPINNIPALVQIMAWRRPGDKPLSEAMLVRLATHICVTRPQWVNAGTGVIYMIAIDRTYYVLFNVVFKTNNICYNGWYTTGKGIDVYSAIYTYTLCINNM